MLPIFMIPGVSDLLPSIPGMDLLPTTSEMYNVNTPLRLSTIGSFVCCMFMFVNVIQKLGPLPKGSTTNDGDAPRCMCLFCIFDRTYRL